MSERFSRLFTIPQNLYAKGSPVVISAGALLKDNQSNNVLVQLKIKNISASKIKAVKLTIQPLDTKGTKLGDAINYSYLDLSINRDDEFGQKNLIPLPDKESRGFEVRITDVVFSDNTDWKECEENWETLPVPASVETIGDAEFVKQFRIRYGEEGKYVPLETKDLWLCSCGAINHNGELCHCCGRGFVEITSEIIESIKKERDARIQQEKEEVARKAEESRISAEKAANKRKKVIAIATPIVAACIAFFLVLTNVIIPNSKYNAALKLYNAGQYEEAIVAFEALDGHKDSAEQIKICKTAIIDAEYDTAVELYNAGQYEEAMVAFETLDGYKDSTEQIKLCKYYAAVELYNEGQYKTAIAAFKAMNGYKDSAEQIELCEREILKSASVGDTVIFGAYEQDDNASNGKENIEWIVLDKKGNKILLISEKALDCQQYNTSATDVTWETCSLRKWMNGTFLNAAFSADEQSLIQSTTVSEDKNDEFTSSGNAKTDKAFLLSETEAKKYFPFDMDRACLPTAYAKAYGTTYGTRSGNCYWWLRTYNHWRKTIADYVKTNGSIWYDTVNCAAVGVRPALWINLNF